MKHVILFSITILFLANCNKYKNEDTISICSESSIDSIRVIYFNVDITTFKSVKCSEIVDACKYRVENASDESQMPHIDYLNLVDTLIIDCEPLLEIEKELNSLNVDNNVYPVDARLVALIYFKNGIQSQICLSGNLASKICYNGIFQQENLKLIYQIKKHAGYYSWFSEEVMKYMKELNDTTFVRDSILVTYENNPRVR